MSEGIIKTQYDGIDITGNPQIPTIMKERIDDKMLKEFQDTVTINHDQKQVSVREFSAYIAICMVAVCAVISDISVLVLAGLTALFCGVYKLKRVCNRNEAFYIDVNNVLGKQLEELNAKYHGFIKFQLLNAEIEHWNCKLKIDITFVIKQKVEHITNKSIFNQIYELQTTNKNLNQEIKSLKEQLKKNGVNQAEEEELKKLEKKVIKKIKEFQTEQQEFKSFLQHHPILKKYKHEFEDKGNSMQRNYQYDDNAKEIGTIWNSILHQQITHPSRIIG